MILGLNPVLDHSFGSVFRNTAKVLPLAEPFTGPVEVHAAGTEKVVAVWVLRC